MTVYRPSARVRLTIRTEEFEETEELESRLPDPFTNVPSPPSSSERAPQATSAQQSDTSAERLRLNQERRRQLESNRSALPREEYEAQRQQIDEERAEILRDNAPGSDETSTPPESVAGVSRDDLTVVGEIEPVSVQIEYNGLSAADTATIVMDYIDAPIDPRIVRAAHVEVLVGVVRADDYEAGMERRETRRDGSLLSLVGADDDGTLLGATRFVGFVDDWTAHYGDDGDRISLECRDMSGPLRDIPLPHGASIDTNLPIDEGISQFLEAVSATTRGITIIYGDTGTPPTPATAAPQRRRARRGRVNRRGRRSDQNMSLWDHTNDVVRATGLIPIVRDFDIVLIRPRTLFTAAGATRMVYGRNLTNLEFSRKLSGVKVPTIEVRAYDSDRGRTIWARYPVADGQRASGVIGVDDPPRPRRANNVPPSGSNPSEQIRNVSVSGVTDPEVLRRIAQNYYEEVGRQEIEGKFETFDVWGYDMTPEDADLLSLRAGDPVELLVAQAAGEDEEAAGSSTTLARLQAMDRQRRTDYMVSLGWDRNVASRFAALQDATGFQTVFRVQDVRLSWDADSGLKMSVSFVNYVVIRDEGESE